MTTSDKEIILKSIREALARDRARSLDDDAVEPVEEAASSPPNVDQADLVRQFAEELSAVGAEVFMARTAEGARGYIRDIIRRRQARRVAMSSAPLIESLNLAAIAAEADVEVVPLPVELLHRGLERYKNSVATADVGVTGVDYGLADSGTLVIQVSRTEGRLASVLPPVHIALIRPDRILPGIAELIRVLGHPTGSGVIFITGPSRTADIELTLTIGVHGPGELHVVIIE